MTLILTHTSDKAIKFVQAIPLETGNDLSQKTKLFTNVPVGTYHVYVVANTSASLTANPHVTAGNAGIAPTTIAGNVDNYLAKLVAHSGSKLGIDAAGVELYKEPTEVFIAYQTGVTIAADTKTVHPTPFKLTRAVSMLRVRIDRDHGQNGVDNSGVKFETAGKSAFRLSNSNTGLKVSDNTVFGATKKMNVYSGKQWKTADPTTGYNPTNMGLDADYQLWNDYIVFPGGHENTSSKKFGIVVIGWAPKGYILLDPREATGTREVTNAAGEGVFWTGTVNDDAVANGILVVNAKLLTAGTTIEVEIPENPDNGSLEITVQPVDWGAIEETDVPM